MAGIRETSVLEAYTKSAVSITMHTWFYFMLTMISRLQDRFRQFPKAWDRGSPDLGAERPLQAAREGAAGSSKQSVLKNQMPPAFCHTLA